MKLTIKKDELNILRLALAVCAVQDVRYYLSGFMLDFGPEHIQIVSTDGHRLAADVLPYHEEDGDIEEAKERGQVIIGTGDKRIKLPKTADRAEILFLDDSVDGTLTLYKGVKTLKILPLKIVDGRYPDWHRVVPKDPGVEEANSFAINPSYLNDFVAPLVGLKYPCVKVEFGAGGNTSALSVTVREHSTEHTKLVLMPVRW